MPREIQSLPNHNHCPFAHLLLALETTSVSSPEDDPPTTILRDPKQVKEKKFLEEFINTSEMRIRVGSEVIVKILMNANKVGPKSLE